jgi:hypothetical protein
MKRLLAYLFIILGLGLMTSVNAAGNLQGFLNAIENSKESGFTIDLDSTAKEYDYKNFKGFVKDYKKEYELPDLTENEVREFLLEVDRKAKIVESQENLDKLYDLVMNNKYFVKYQKKKNSYLNSFKKGKYKRNSLDNMALAVYMNYEKEISKISNDPNLKEITRFEWGWGWSDGSYSPIKWAIKDCITEAKKIKLSGGECIIIDHRFKNPDKIVNYLKPRL